ncbi:hypothetical protein [Luteococcus sanguinis]|uniref:Uncharacterized protein n=1 Tax=Luteococcus sanguinis TaxID=174038 RepID=A0ABW1X3E1_9ACTN
MDGAYSAVADQQLDALEESPDVDRYNAVLDVIEDIFANPSLARLRSQGIRTEEGYTLLVIAVPRQHPLKVFWRDTDQGPRIEAIFPRP